MRTVTFYEVVADGGIDHGDPRRYYGTIKEAIGAAERNSGDAFRVTCGTDRASIIALANSNPSIWCKSRVLVWRA